LGQLILKKAIGELRFLLGEDAISTDDEDLYIHGYSEWSSINIDQMPVAVAYPRSTEEVSQIARICHQYKVPMGKQGFPVDCLKIKSSEYIAVPYSGGSSLEANFSAPYGGMSIDFTHMDKVLELHADEYVEFQLRHAPCGVSILTGC
jgi:D-lactate dehydrogenase (cytochrome)